MLFPATGAESRWTQGLDVFVRQVSRATAASCAHDHGIGLPEDVPVAFIRFFEVPDLDFIALHGLSESAQVPALETGPAATRPGSSAVVRRFLAEHADEVRELRETLVPSLRSAEKEHGVSLAFPAP
jgi:hypothetical protein